MKKEDYFSTNQQGEAFAAALNDAGLGRRLGAQGFEPAVSALLVLDMQRYFLESESHAHVPSGAQIVSGLQRLATLYAQQTFPVIYTQHINTAADAGNMAAWWRDVIDADDPLAAIIPDFSPTPAQVVVKSQYDAFYETDLFERLAAAGVQQVVIGGVMTHLCCETTARAAFTRGLDVFFLLDGTASYNRAFHLAALTNLAHGFARIVTVGEILAALA